MAIMAGAIIVGAGGTADRLEDGMAEEGLPAAASMAVRQAASMVVRQAASMAGAGSRQAVTGSTTVEAQHPLQRG